MSMKTLIISYLKNKSWTHKGEIEREAILNHWGEGDTISRRCRELYCEGRLDKTFKNGQVLYKYVPKNRQTTMFKVRY